jgi:hypothetical protein
VHLAVRVPSFPAPHLITPAPILFSLLSHQTLHAPPLLSSARQSEGELRATGLSLPTRAQRYLFYALLRRRFAIMAAEGEATNPVAGGGGGDSYTQEAAAAAEDAAQEPAGEMANPEGAVAAAGGAVEKDDGACGDLVLVEGPEAVPVEDPDEGTAPRSSPKKTPPASRRVTAPVTAAVGLVCQQRDSPACSLIIVL